MTVRVQFSDTLSTVAARWRRRREREKKDREKEREREGAILAGIKSGCLVSCWIEIHLGLPILLIVLYWRLRNQNSIAVALGDLPPLAFTLDIFVLRFYDDNLSTTKDFLLFFLLSILPWHQREKTFDFYHRVSSWWIPKTDLVAHTPTMTPLRSFHTICLLNCILCNITVAGLGLDECYVSILVFFMCMSIFSLKIVNLGSNIQQQRGGNRQWWQ